MALSLSLVALCVSSHASSVVEIPETAQCNEDNASSMLQAKASVSQGEVEVSEDQKWAPGDKNPVGKVNWDGHNTFDIKRTEVEGLAAEVLFRLPMTQFTHKPPGVDYARNETHVFMPYNVMMDATFVRDMHNVGSYEYGVAKWVWEPNPVSVFGPAVVVGAGEKWHTLSHCGAWSTESRDKVREVQQAREDSGTRETTERQAALSRFERNYGVNMWMLVNELGPRVLAAGIDPNVLMDVMTFVEEPFDPNGDSSFAWSMWNISASLTAKHNEFVEGLTEGEVPEVAGTALSCYHLHQSPHLTLVPDHGFWWPLGKKLASVRGQTLFSPLALQSNMVGTSVAYYNADDDSIDIYQGAASQSLVIDPTVPSGAGPNNDANLWVGHADGGDRPIPADGRQPLDTQHPGLSAMVYQMYQGWNAAPADFHYLSMQPDEPCPQAEMEAIRAELQNADFKTMMSAESSDATKANAVRIMTTMIDCSVDFLSTDEEDAHAYGPIEALVFVHGVYEFKFGVLMRGWNEIDFPGMGIQTRGGKGGKGGGAYCGKGGKGAISLSTMGRRRGKGGKGGSVL